MKPKLQRCLAVAGLFAVASTLPSPSYAKIENSQSCGRDRAFTAKAEWLYCDYYLAEEGYANVAGFASPGVLKARAQASANKNATPTSGRATIEVSDYVTFNASGLAGKTGKATASSIVYGSTLVSPNGIGRVAASGGVGVRVGGSVVGRFRNVMLTTDSLGQHEVTNDYGSDNGKIVPYTDVLPISWEFTYGEPFLVKVTMDVIALAIGHGLAQTSFDRSWYWTGIQSVTFEGVPVPYTLTSESGTDWSRSFLASAVPEPATAALLPLGLLVVGAAARGKPKR